MKSIIASVITPSSPWVLRRVEKKQIVVAVVVGRRGRGRGGGGGDGGSGTAEPDSVQTTGLGAFCVTLQQK